ncbi:MAG: SdiA-regulated domain-containing protein [Lutibacter sp.]|nr:SdiA-regulated domain-containing protein [Lutibacter sp.]
MKKVGFLVFLAIILISCLSKVSSENELELVKTIKLAIPEPSGLTLFNNNLFIVSDHNGIIYQTSLEGKILHKIKTNFDDLEGITIDEDSKNFLLVSEKDRAVIVLDSLGDFIKKINIKGKQKHYNGGLEGICFFENSVYVINEKSPRQLLLLNKDGEILNKIKLNYSKDISGICFDKISNSFWIVSDESKLILNINNKGTLIKSFKIAVAKAEGIAINDNNLFIVSDSSKSLAIFKIPN